MTTNDRFDPIVVQPLSEDEELETETGGCPYYASTHHEGCCTLTNTICPGPSKNCEDRRSASCVHGSGDICPDYDECKCRDCWPRGNCVDTACEETCSCRPDLGADFLSVSYD